MSEMLPVLLLLWVVLHMLSVMRVFVEMIGSERNKHYEHGDESLGRNFRKAQRWRLLGGRMMISKSCDKCCDRRYDGSETQTLRRGQLPRSMRAGLAWLKLSRSFFLHC
ncbi:hypothetical protein BGZ60DRAFT_197253 [Tricladium varicosporioides]|nr:hypothetical protein BGZ60DRAFT_197253 [Hymenoscyphus varicosporioides]